MLQLTDATLEYSFCGLTTHFLCTYFFSFSILAFPKDIYIDISFLSWSHLVPNIQ